MRLFIGIPLPEQTKKELYKLSGQLRQEATGGKFVPRENYHVTLHFVGETNMPVELTEAMHEAVRGIRPFSLHLGSYDTFGADGRFTSVVDIKGHTDELTALYESLEEALFDRGFSREPKKYRPHVTLGRNVGHDELVKAELADVKLSASFMVNSICLFISERINGKMVYSVMHTEKLTDSRA